MNCATGRQAGFTYLGLLFAIVILGLTLSTVGVVWSTQIRREREAELLFVGNQYRVAIGRYRAAGALYPRSLTDLLEDKRVPLPRRYLRRLYPDPMTGHADWEIIAAPDGGIMGVASVSRDQPIKVAGFGTADKRFENADCYCGWRFIDASNSVNRLPDISPAPSN